MSNALTLAVLGLIIRFCRCSGEAALHFPIASLHRLPKSALVITQARLGRITNPDRQNHLSILTMQEISLKRELSSLGQAISINALKNWEARVTEYLADLQAGVDGLNNAVPQTDEERQEIFQLKKRTVNSLVERVTIDEKRELTVRI